MQISEERMKYIRDNKKLSLILAYELLNDLETVVKSNGNLYVFNGKHYDILTKDDLTASFQQFVVRYGIPECWEAGKINNVFLAISTAAAERIKEVGMNEETNLLCLNNGVLNTETKELLPHSPSFYFDTAIDITYDPQETSCQSFIKYLREVQSGNEENIKNIIRLGGYLLDYSPKNIKKCNKIFIFDGPGGAGKSTLIDIFRLFFAEKQITALTLEDLSGKNFENSQLLYSRVNFCGEQKRSYVDAEGLKLISEGSAITVRPIYQPAITIRPKTKVVISCNGLPRFNDTSDGIYRRLFIFRFRNQYKNKKEYEKIRDPQKRGIYIKNVDLFDEIEKEKSAIFNLFLQGLEDLKKDKFQFIETDDQEAILEEFKTDNDVAREFLKEKYEVNELCKTPIKAIYHDYAIWYRSNLGGQLKMRSNEIGKRIIETFNVKSNGRARYQDPYTNEWEQLTTYPIGRITYDDNLFNSSEDTNGDVPVDEPMVDTNDSQPFQSTAVWDV